MKIQKITIDGFGLFTRETGGPFEFDPHGTTQIVGENESGKSTLVQAILGIIYGIRDKELEDRQIPWQMPRTFGGQVEFAVGEKQYAVYRNFIEYRVRFVEKVKGKEKALFDGYDNPRSRSGRPYIEKLQSHTNLPSYGVVVNTTIIPQKGLAVDPGDELKSLLTGAGCKGYDSVLEDLMDSYKAITKKNPWGVTLRKDRQLEKINCRLVKIEEEMQKSEALAKQQSASESKVDELRSKERSLKEQLETAKNISEQLDNLSEYLRQKKERLKRRRELQGNLGKIEGLTEKRKNVEVSIREGYRALEETELDVKRLFEEIKTLEDRRRLRVEENNRRRKRIEELDGEIKGLEGQLNENYSDLKDQADDFPTRLLGYRGLLKELEGLRSDLEERLDNINTLKQQMSQECPELDGLDMDLCNQREQILSTIEHYFSERQSHDEKIDRLNTEIEAAGAERKQKRKLTTIIGMIAGAIVGALAGRIFGTTAWIGIGSAIGIGLGGVFGHLMISRSSGAVERLQGQRTTLDENLREERQKATAILQSNESQAQPILHEIFKEGIEKITDLLDIDRADTVLSSLTDQRNRLKKFAGLHQQIQESESAFRTLSGLSKEDKPPDHVYQVPKLEERIKTLERRRESLGDLAEDEDPDGLIQKFEEMKELRERVKTLQTDRKGEERGVDEAEAKHLDREIQARIEELKGLFGDIPFESMLEEFEDYQGLREERDRLKRSLEEEPDPEEIQSEMESIDADLRRIGDKLDKLLKENPGLQPLKDDAAGLIEQVDKQKKEVEQLQGDYSRIDEALRREEQEAARLSGLGISDLELLREEQHRLKEQQNKLIEKRGALRTAVDILKECIDEYRAQYLERLEEVITAYYQEITGQQVRIRLAEDFSIRLSNDVRDTYDQADLSVGADDQLYIAIRLAVADEIGGVEPMPFILDDPFVNTDAIRLENIRKIFERLAEQRQTILLTHDTLAYEKWGKKKIEL